MRLKGPDTFVYFSSGFKSGDRKRAIIKPFDNEPVMEEYQITILKAKYDSKFAKITHRHVLGTIMSLGIERNTFGDILVDDDYIYIAVSNEILEYILLNFTEVLRWPLKFTKCLPDDIEEKPGEVKNLICASLRLDCVIARAFNLSRGEAVDLINKGKAFVNYKQILSTDFHVGEKDIISLRTYGRVTILNYIGKTKKMRECISVDIKH